ncbi:MAG TPA: serine/threonine-protein kinase [Vicinamibacterales bacterium]|nr:serine/threonine-protein kinase [Vicinamibacterales bacterium]
MIGRAVGKYRILERIGRGGMGTVYRAVDDMLQRDVAIKVLNAENTDPDALRRFRREAITLAKLHHPAIATLFELCEDDGDLLMVMEFVRGETLQKLAERTGQVPPDFAAQLCGQVLDGLAHAHRAGIVHRDLKPGNIMVTEEGLVKVMDFGIARISGSEHLTSDGFTMGTPAYMAPEQLLGHEADARSDLYAVGVLLYRLWTGRLPFEGDTPFAIAHKQLHDMPTPLNVACPTLPAWCDAILARALAKDPAERFQKAQDFKSALASSSSLGTLDDAATATMHTPNAMFLTARSAPSSGVPVRTSGIAAVGEHRLTGSGIQASPRTLVISVKHMVAGVGVLIFVFAALAAGGVAMIRRMLPVAPWSAQPAPATSTAAAPVAPTPPAAGAGTPVPPPTSAPTPSVRGSLPAQKRPDPVKPSDAIPAGPSLPRSGASKDVAVATARPTAVPPPIDASAPGPSAAPASAAALPPVTFDKLNMLVTEGETTHEVPAELQFSGGRVAIYGPGKRLVASVPYGSVRELSSSRSKQPRWRRADGSVSEAKVGTGPLGFMKSDRNWFGLVTSKTVYVMRIDDNRVRPFSDAVTQRTGAPLVRLSK